MRPWRRRAGSRSESVAVGLEVGRYGRRTMPASNVTDPDHLAVEALLARPHFIAIGGIGMSGLARICVARGAVVSGSDANDSATLDALRRLGCAVHVGHAVEHVPADATVAVVSSAIRPNNPELVEAERRGLVVMHRAELLARLMDGRRAVVVAGTHGKSSTSSMLAVAFGALGLDPSYAIGAELAEPGSNARHGTGEVFIAEADESDRSFHRYRPQLAIVLNIEEDHHDHYGSLAEHLDSYATFTEQIEAGGTLVVCLDDSGARDLASRVRAARDDIGVVTYGFADDADLHIDKVTPESMTSRVVVTVPEHGAVSFTVGVPGAHMAHNAVAALGAGIAAGVEASRMATALEQYTGIKRRFTTIGERAGVLVIDSYAHHPTEVVADLATARTVAEARAGRVIVVFQPHLYTRTAALGADNGRALAAADVALVLPIYGGREDPIKGVTHRSVIDAAVDAGGLMSDVADLADAAGVTADLSRAGDVVLTMGAGDVTKLGPMILAELETPEGQDPP